MYNLDYLIVARLGPVMVPSFLKRLARLSEVDSTACAEIGRRMPLKRSEQAGAMRFSIAFWVTMFWAALIMAFLTLVLIGEIFGRDVLQGPTMLILATFLGIYMFATISCVFSVVRLMNLRDP